MFGYTMHRLTGFWALLFIFIGIGFTAQAQTVTGSDTLFIEGGSWEFFDFSSEMAFTIADTGSFDADIRGSSNEGVNFGQEFSSAVRDSAIQLLGMGSVDTVTSAPAWKETGTWVTTSWESTGFQPIQVGQLWAVYTAEGHYAVMEITALPEGDFGSSFAFDYVYQTDGTRFFDGSGEPVATAPTTNPADPMPRDTADIVSIYGDTYNTISGINYNPDWGQSGINDVDPNYDPGTGNPILAYPNFNYQGTDLPSPMDFSTMDYIHIDIWVAEGTDRMVKFTPVDNSGNGPGEVLVEVPVTPGSWNSVDLPKSAFTDMSWESVFQLKFDGQFNADGSANTEPFDIYVDNIFFYDEFTPIGDARALEAGTEVVITGITSTPNYGFSNGQWFIQDETGGINVFFPGAGDQEVAVGDEHILYGTVSSFDGQIQISVDSAEVVSTGNDIFVYEIGIEEFLNVNSDFQGSYVQLNEIATYLASESLWPVEGFSDWAGAGTNVAFQVGQDTITYRIDRDEAFFDGTPEPADGDSFILSGIMSRFNENPQFYGGFFEDDIVNVSGPDGNLVINGDFEAGDDGSWYGSGLNILTDGGNSYNFVDVTVAGNPWDVNLSQDVELTPGAYYELTFDAVTSDGNTRIMSAGIGLSQEPFYASTDDVMLTDTMQTFTLGLFASDATTGTDFGNDTSRVIFDMGADLGVVEIDNVSLVEAEAPVIELTTIAAAKDSSDGTLVKVQGIAITPSLESDSRTSFFIQDEGQGLNIFNFGTPSKEIEAGDLVEVTGEMETFNGLREILVRDIETDITVLSSGNTVPEPRVITYEEFTAASFPDTDTANIQGTLVRINDLSTDPADWPADAFASSTNVTATTSADSAVAIRLLAQTEAIGVFPPTNFDLIGVIGTFNGAQMLPRFASDIIGDYPDVELNFQVDMSVQELAGNFDPATDTISVTGVFDGWDASANMMTEIDTSGFYEATVSFPLDGPVPQTYAYKFTIVGDDGSITWESGDDSQITVTEEDFNGTNYVTSNTIPDGVPFFDGIGFDDIFLENTDVIFEVDLRPAYYYIEDNGSLPSFSGEESVTTVDWLFANGPLIAGSWESWGLSQGDAESLGTAFVDDGTSGDAVAGDSIFTLTKSYSPGDEVEGAFKLGVNGYDNESDFAVDHYLRIGDSNVVEVIFGAVFNGEIVNDDVYDEYILKTEEGPVVVRSGGTEGDFVENIIVDGDFTSDVLPESWTFFEGEGAVADFSVIDNEAAVTNVSGAGGATWHLQLIQFLSQEQIDKLTVGETYKISFDARSNVDGRPFRVFFGEDGGAFTGIAVVDTVANTEMQTYTYYTTLSQTFDNMKFAFEVGLSNDDFFVDNVSISEVEGVVEPMFGSNDIIGFLGETNELSFELVELGSETIESFEFELTYDPTLVDITVPEQFGTLAENFTVEVNAETPGTILVSAAGTQGITDTGTLFVFDVLGLDNGEGSLEFTNVVYNETYVPGFSSLLSIFEFICGDVTGDGQISAMDASWVLRHTVKLAPQYPLVGADSSAADVTGNGWISAFDASQILKYNVGLPAIFSCSESQAKAAPLAINAEWDYTPPAETQSIISMPIKISEINAELTAAQIEVPIAEGLAFKGLRNTPENWQVTTNVNDGTVYISLFGVEGIQQELLGALEFEVLNNSRPLSVSASVTLNENAPVQLKEVNLFELPSEFELSQNYPNPFNPTTQIKYSVPHDAKVQLTVYNLLGQKVAELVNEQKSPGKYTISWDAGNNASGVYMYRLAAGNKVFTKKMMLIK